MYALTYSTTESKQTTKGSQRHAIAHICGVFFVEVRLSVDLEVLDEHEIRAISIVINLERVTRRANGWTHEVYTPEVLKFLW